MDFILKYILKHIFPYNVIKKVTMEMQAAHTKRNLWVEKPKRSQFPWL